MSVPGLSVSREIAIFWDYENVPLPENCHVGEVSKCINSAVSKFGRIVDRRLYSDSRKWNAGLSTANRRFLDSSGFDLVDTPSKGQKETIDKKMIADILSFAWDCAVRNDASGLKPCVVLITSDGDYAYTLSKLRDRGVMSVVFYGRQCTVAQVLVDTADVALSFEKDVLASIKRDDPMVFVRPSKDASSEEAHSFHEVPKHDIDDDILTFCKGVLSVQQAVKKKGIGINITIDECWATDLHVGGFFKKFTHSCEFDAGRGGADKQRYQQVRFQAVSKGLVQPGRRILSSSASIKEIIPVVWDDNAGKREGLSSEVYLRLTEGGKSYCNTPESNLSPLRPRQSENIQSDAASLYKDVEYAGNVEKVVWPSSVADDDDHFGSTTDEQHDNALTPSTSGQIFAPNEDLVLFCQCVHKIRTIVSSRGSELNDDVWATDASVAEMYRKYERKTLYKDVREVAISSLLVEVGRRDRTDKSKDMTLVAWSDNAGRKPGLSDEIYLRLTFKGGTVISSSLLSSIRPKTSDEQNPASTALEGASAVRSMWSSSQGSNVGSEVSECTQKSKPESARKVHEALSSVEGSVVFCKCVKSLQITAMKNNDDYDFSSYWVTDSTISAHFRSGASALTSAKITSKDYKSARDKSIEDGLVEAGRRLIGPHFSSKNIVPVNWQENAGKRDGLASEVYLRLTKGGIAKLKTMQAETDVVNVRKQEDSKKAIVFSSAPFAADSSRTSPRKSIGSDYFSRQDESIIIGLGPTRIVDSEDFCERPSRGQVIDDEWNCKFGIHSREPDHIPDIPDSRQGRSLFDRKAGGQYTSRDISLRGNTSTSRLIGTKHLGEFTEDTRAADRATTARLSESFLLPAPIPSKIVDDSVAFLSCMTAAQLKVMGKEKVANQTSDSWATDAAVAGLFFEEFPSPYTAIDRAALKQRYKDVRDQKRSEGLIVTGRRHRNGDKIGPPMETTEETDDHSPELYLRLTESGWSVVAALSHSIRFPDIIRFTT